MVHCTYQETQQVRIPKLRCILVHYDWCFATGSQNGVGGGDIVLGMGVCACIFKRVASVLSSLQAKVTKSTLFHMHIGTKWTQHPWFMKIMF